MNPENRAAELTDKIVKSIESKIKIKGPYNPFWSSIYNTLLNSGMPYMDKSIYEPLPENNDGF
jgi:hypothetical protein